MRFIVIALSLSIIVAVACGSEDRSAESTATATPDTVPPTASTATATPDTVPPTASPDVEVMEVSVGPQRESCVGSYPMMCMVVDGELFYDEIEGFEFEPGYEYELRIERYDRWWPNEPPQDAGKYGYRLIEVIRKTMVQQ